MKINRKFGNTFFNLDDDLALKYKQIVQADSEFLCSQGLMDYSLLLVVEQSKLSK